MINEKIKEAYEQLAPSYNEFIDHKPHNAHYDRPNTLKLMGNVKGKSILDAACGPGKYAEELISRGAEVVGFDSSPKMVSYAKERNPTGKFFVHDLNKTLSFTNGSFDIVLCALALHYVENWGPTIREFHRVLKPNGRLVISIEHPFFEYNYFKSSKYFEIEPVKCTWKGFDAPVEMNSYRRSLQECIGPIVANGFVIDNLIEPRPTKEFEAIDPKHFAELNSFPAFMCIGCTKK